MQTINYKKNIVKETFVSNYPQIKNFFIDKVKDINILKHVILDYLPLYHKWSFTITSRKGCYICCFNSMFYATSIIECWRLLKDTLKKDHFALINFEEFKYHIYKYDDTLYFNQDKPNTIYIELVLIPISMNLTDDIHFNIYHHKYFNRIENEKQLNEIFNDYNSFYKTKKIAYFNKTTNIIDNLDPKTTLKDIDESLIDINDYKKVTWLNYNLKRCIHVGFLYKKARIIKNKLCTRFKSDILPHRNGKFVIHKFGENLNIKFEKMQK